MEDLMTYVFEMCSFGNKGSKSLWLKGMSSAFQLWYFVSKNICRRETCHDKSGKISLYNTYIQGGFFLLVRPEKWLSVRLHRKSHQKSSKCQNFLRIWHWVIFRADQSKKPPCTYFTLFVKISQSNLWGYFFDGCRYCTDFHFSI